MSFKFNRLKRNISKILNFTPEILTNDITVAIYGGYQAVISGYKKILVYDDSLLVVCSSEKQLKIMGSNLILSEMAQDELTLKGNITSAELESRRRQA